LTPSTVVVITTVPGSTQDVFAEGNLSKISPTIPIDISVKPRLVENVHIGASCSPTEIVTYTSLFKETTVISHCNPMQHILKCQLLGGKYSKWIFILQEFDLEFDRATSKKSLVFAELICDFPHIATEKVAVDSLPDESLFLISTDDIWYGYIIIYLQNQTFWLHLSSNERRRVHYQARHYIILDDTLYRRGIDSIFWRCLTFDEAEKALNDCHSGACGGHMSGYATAQKILRAGYFWPSLFKNCITVVQKCHAC
jgi:hypothetical protein